jgi:Fe2+ transport system protein B
VRFARNGFAKTEKVVISQPNVGKSTFFDGLAGSGAH